MTYSIRPIPQGCTYGVFGPDDKLIESGFVSYLEAEAFAQTIRFVPLTQGAYAIVDTVNYDWLAQWQWHLNNRGYASRNDRSTGKKRTVLMHRAIMGVSCSGDIDHRDTNRLNNCRSNLRPATRSQNVQNARVYNRRKSSQFKGVSWCKRNQKWAAQLHSKFLGNHHLGYFTEEIKAAKAYDTAARHYYGEFARPNF